MTISSLYCPFTVQSSPSDSKLIFSKHWFWFVFYTTTWIEACGLLLRKPQWLPPASWTQCQTPIQELTCPTSLQVPSPWEAGLFCSRDCISLVLVPDFLLSFLCPVFSLSLEERPIAPLHHIASFIEHWESPVLPPNLCWPTPAQISFSFLWFSQHLSVSADSCTVLFSNSLSPRHVSLHIPIKLWLQNRSFFLLGPCQP